ncbi:MAG: Gldg family protein [Proteobacteria bacterium]|nr:Gldg family protein [Pseudomonadota bacterium]
MMSGIMKWLENRERSRLAAGGLALAVVLLLAFNIFANATFQSLRLDLTEGKLFTLSQGTLNVLRAIDEPITVKLYYTKLLGERSPQHATYFERVRELLEQYADVSGGKLRLELLNPEPFTDAEDNAVAAGLQGAPLNNAGDLGYFGLAATNSTDERAVIPFFTPERETFLEYDLTKVVYTLANPERKVVGVMSRLPIEGGATRPPYSPSPRWAVMDQINEFFEIQSLPNELREIPQDIDILMLVHPKGLNDYTLYAIDQFVLGGGRALVFVDASADVEPTTRQQLGRPRNSEFNRILKTWGLELTAGKFAGDLDAARRVNITVDGKMTVADYVAWLSLTPRNLDTADVVTGDIRLLNLVTAGILAKTDTPGTTVSPLVFTGPESMRISTEKILLQPDVVGMFRDFKPGGKPLMLAARVKGDVKTAFPDGPPKTDDRTGDPAKHLGQSEKPVNLIVIADVDMLHDRYWVNVRNIGGQRLLIPFANNADFVVNALDNLGGSEALIGLRGRADSRRPFHKVQAIRREAERQFRTKEKALLVKLDDVSSNLQKLERRSGTDRDLVLSAKDKASIDEFRNEMIVVRKELRGVQRALRKDIEQLDAWLKFLNIAAIPLLLAIGTIILTVVSRVRRKGRAVAD